MPDQQLHSRPTRIAVIGNYIPRRCGTATFTTDLAESLAAEAPGSEVWTTAMNDTPDGYPYPSRVHFEVNMNGVEVASLQHPGTVLLRGDEWVLAREETYERQGCVSDVVFPCGCSAIAVATARVAELLDWLHKR